MSAVVVFTGWLGAWFFLSDASSQLASWTERQVLNHTADAGFAIQNVLVDGREYADSDTLKAIINVQKGDPLFSFRPAEAKEMIERLSWVKTAHIERRLPDTIYIRIDERQPMALWQRGRRLSLIDKEGVVLTDQNLKRFQNLIIVAGEAAPQKTEELLTLLEAEPSIQEKVESAVLISERRWDLSLESGAKVNLPEEELGFALRRLAVMHEQEALLDKKVMTIDVRQADKITVRTMPGAVQEYKASYNSENNI